ncbi:MAG TPA: DedA family protein [Prolixibacteraceae bacterium]|nr:DedA family protein [Prolixibacteraceae bacterium]HPS13024.1 DedA family protein [Prolixibacteraceae bacterium]
MMDFFQSLADWYMNNMSYVTIFLLMALESTFVPMPSEIVIPPAAWKAASGDLNVFMVVLVATAGAIIGASFNYFMSLWLGRPIVYAFAESKVGKLFLLSKEKVMKAEAYFDDHGKSSTFIGRLVPGIRHLISIPAGLAKMDFKQFILFTAIGSTLWHAILAALSYFLYSQKEMFDKYMKEISYGLLVIGIVFIAYLVLRAIRKKR